MSPAMALSPVRLHVYFKLDLQQADAWRARWREAASLACKAHPGLQVVLSERPETDMTWMESYRGSHPAQMADGQALVARALQALGVERHQEVFVETFRAGF
jgi:Domain of unknown function (DUF4936)